MASLQKSLAQAIRDRRATPSFDGEPIPPRDLWHILDAGLHAPSGYNMQPWRFIVVQNPDQRRKLRAVCYNQAKVEEASAIIVACGDRDGWRRDLEEMLRMGRAAGMPESYAAQAAANVPEYLSEFSHDEMAGFEQQGICETLRLPMSYWVVSLLAIGHLKGADKFDGGRFDPSHTVFSEEYGKPLK
jgi:hypothetical protein